MTNVANLWPVIRTGIPTQRYGGPLWQFSMTVQKPIIRNFWARKTSCSTTKVVSKTRPKWWHHLLLISDGKLLLMFVKKEWRADTTGLVSSGLSAGLVTQTYTRQYVSANYEKMLYKFTYLLTYRMLRVNKDSVFSQGQDRQLNLQEKESNYASTCRDMQRPTARMMFLLTEEPKSWQQLVE